VQGISCNSKQVSDNFVFVAIKGSQEDGHKFIDEAISRGANTVIVQATGHRPQATDKINFIRVKDTRRALARLAGHLYGHPSSKIKVIGITGTNGKTTVSYLIESLLKEAGFTPAVIGTVNYRFKNRVIPSKNTTPGPIELQFLLSDMLKEGVDYAVMEVSSHALHQDRTEGINFCYNIFTNLTQDHLDYHKTIANYFQAKSKLFQNMNSGSLAVINNDDKYGRRLKRLTGARVITYGINNHSDILAKDIKFDISHTEFILKGNNIETKLKTKLIGNYNVYNILSSVAFALGEGLDLSTIKKGIEEFCLVPGRLQKIDFDGNFRVIVDYAHTEDALRNVIATLRQLSKNKIIVVFGCGGERDRTKRPKMGRVVSELADYAIITSDNPRSEDPQAIINDIKRGIGKTNYCVIPPRFEAIRKSLALAKSGDIVLVAGKGHENYQILKDGIVHFDDCEVIRECLKSMNY
jgi:UDP-N-acetylmuramoyl-L-alanyl-D-glutamate--2,6-diaminopimelate ligase